MKRINMIALLMLVAGSVWAQTWAVDKNHSKVNFGVTHLMISEVNGAFKTFDATITATQDDFSDAVFEVSADIASISTDNENRDKDMISERWFDAAKFPKFTFKSTSFKKVDGNKYKITGDLTLKGVTKTIELDAVLNGPITHQRSKKLMVGLKVTGTIKRTDFGVGGAGNAVVSEEVIIVANGEFIKG